jgi:ribosomal RNA-processing protein 8
MFTEYHEGFRRQVEVWPENPVDGYIVQIQARGKVRGPQPKGSEISQNETALPRTEGTCSIADLGCGDAALSTALQPVTKKLHLKIHSFDLQSPSPLVTKADIANLPLPDNSIDVAIFCLALMGTNWVDFIEEAFRILRWKGELWIAEIKSRFGRVGKSKVVSHSIGNRKRPLDQKIQKRQEEEADDAVAAVEVDGHEDRNAETDVSAFVEVLRKRGFVLKGEGRGGESSAIDLSNKMFVRMHFIKGATPIKGKYVPVPKGMEKMGLETWKKKPKGKFIDEDAEEHVSSEANVLKPCVYKLR